MLDDASINRLLAVHIFGWQWVQPPKYDARGPLPEQDMVLAPPSFNADRYEWPVVGIIHPDVFINGQYWNWLRSMSGAIQVAWAADISLLRVRGGWQARTVLHEHDPHRAEHELPELAICIAALRSKGVDVVEADPDCKACGGLGLVAIAPVPAGGKIGGKRLCQECGGTGNIAIGVGLMQKRGAAEGAASVE